METSGHQVSQTLYDGLAGFKHSFLIPFLRGCGQMLFQPSALTGLVFLLLILSQSIQSLSLCMAGTLGSTLCAYFLERPREAYFQGLGGFNGGLLGLALSVFYGPSTMLPALAFAGGALAGVVRVALEKLLPIPSFTSPFIVVAFLVFAGGDILGLAATDPLPGELERVHGLFTGASQVLFQLDVWVGALVFVAVLLHSRRAAIWVGAASLVAWFTALLFDLPRDLTAAGLLGYNGLILAAALQHRGTPLLLAVTGVMLSVWLSYLLVVAGVTPLSVPFVLSAWLVIAADSILFRRSLTHR